MNCETIINLEEEGGESIIGINPEMVVGSAVKSVNGKVGHVVLTTSDLENTSDYQTGSEVESAISTAVGAEATLRENADTALGGRIDNLVTELGNEITTRQTADNSLQGQIDAITVSSDVTDIVGTKAQLDAYDTSKLHDNDIIKVLQDESQNDETTYYRWSTSTHSFTLIGEEGPYYTKSQANELLQTKQDVLTAGDNISISSNVISATDTTYTAGTGLTLTGTEFSADTSVLQEKLTAGNAIDITDNTISADIYPADYFTAGATETGTGTSLSFEGTIPAPLGAFEMYGDSEQQTYTGKNKWYYTDGSRTSSGITWVRSGATVTGNGTASSTSSQMWSLFTLPSILPAGTYTASIAAPVSHRIEFVIQDSGGNNHFDFKIPAGETSITYTTSYDIAEVRGGAGGWSVDDEINITIQNMQFEAGSEATSFEPYVGGVPAPNPEYPQDVHTVTGEQTVTVSDGTNSQSYTIDLGTLELCKIGDYQDYIYKSSDDWYVHKEVSKIDIDSTIITAYNTHNNSHITVNYPNATIKMLSSAAVTNFSNRFVGCTSTQTWGGTVINGVAQGTNNNYLQFSLPLSAGSSQAEVRTYFSNHPTTVYYVLETTTDTKITDATLVAQLDALSQATTYYGETNILVAATGTNLVASSKFTVYKNSAAGVATREAVPADAPTYSDFIGTDGNTPGTSGLVPAPATTDVDKFLKSDGTWATAGGGGGGGVTPVQTTGTSTTDVMSQDATTKMIYPDIANKPYKMVIGEGYINSNKGVVINGRLGNNALDGIAIGCMDSSPAQIGTSGRAYYSIAIGRDSAASRGDNSVAIGSSSTCSSGQNTGDNVAIGYNSYAGNASGTRTVALGAYAKTTRTGEVNVGTGGNNYGFNSTDYRVIGGVHDGQLAHDVATVGQINATIDAINTALSTNIPHIGA